MKKAIVVLSGGQDSTTCLFWAKKNFDYVEAITFDYNQRHKLEVKYAKDLAKDFKIPHTLMYMDLLNELAPSALTRSEIDVEAGEAGGLPNTFVDGRNAVFLLFTAILAKQKGIKNIVTGVCQTDFSGYPDCRDSFVKSMNVTLNLAMDYEFVIHTPLMWMTKAETWQLADELGCIGYIYNHTLTCYNGIKGRGCGKCPACELRQKGFEEYMSKRGGQL